MTDYNALHCEAAAYSRANAAEAEVEQLRVEVAAGRKALAEIIGCEYEGVSCLDLGPIAVKHVLEMRRLRDGRAAERKPHEMDETSPYDLVENHKRRPGNRR